MRHLVLISILAAVAQAEPDPVATSYDELLDKIGDADHTKDVDQAAARYTDVAHAAAKWLAHAPATGRFTTRHDGAADAKKLVATIKALETRAEAAYDRYIEKLEAELHATTPGQRAIVLKRGRPQAVKKKPLMCWIYRDEANEETYCWTKAGKIAEHTTTAIAAAEEPPPAEEPAPKAKAKPKKKRAYYAAATFASGSCSFSNCLKDGWTTETPAGTVTSSCSFSDCGKDGWTSRYPDGAEATTSCHFSDCFKDGWSTTNPDGTSSETSCSFNDCMKDGWTTTMPDGSTATTSCSFNDCMKDGWTTNLPSGKTVTCSCSFNDCLANGASCQ
jgi:hypothetical protein